MEIIKEIFMQNISSSLKLSAVILLLFILTKPITKRYTAGFRYYSWLAVIIIFLIPFGNIGITYKIDISPAIIDISDKTHQIKEWYDKNIPTYTTTEKFIQYNSENNKVPKVSKTVNVTKKLDISIIFSIIWLLGAFTYFIFHFRRYIYYKKTIRRISIILDDINMYSILEKQKNKLNISKNLIIRTSNIVDTPTLIGIFSPEIILPHLNYTDYELNLILRHELFHLKRKDILYQFITLIFVSIHWFNPIVYLMARAIEIDGETSCDEKTLENSEYEEKIFYGEMLLKFLKTEIQKKSYMTTTFFGGKNGMKKRLELIADKKVRIKGTIAMIVIMLTAIITSISAAAMSNEYFDLLFDGDTSYLTEYIKTDKKSVSDERFILTLEQYLVTKGHIMIIFSFEAKTEDAIAELNAVDKDGHSTFFNMDTINISPTDSNKAEITSASTGPLGIGKFDTEAKKYFVLDSDSIVNDEKIDFYMTTDKIKNSPKIIIPMDYNIETKTLEVDNIKIEYSPISIVVSYPITKNVDECDYCTWNGTYLYFRLKNGEIKTFNQLYYISAELYDSEPSDGYWYEKYHTFAWARKIIKPDEIKSIIINDTEYPVDNPLKSSVVNIDENMKSFIIEAHFRDSWGMSLKEFCNGLGSEIEYDASTKSAKFKYDGSEYIVTSGLHYFLKDGEKCDLGEFSPFINENGKLIVPLNFNNYYGIDYMYIDYHLFDKSDEDNIINSTAKLHVIP